MISGIIFVFVIGSDDRCAAAASPLALNVAKAGLLTMLLGGTLEAVGDHQKASAKADQARKGSSATRWVDTGLYSLLRHPNYTGEQVSG
jgi:steroid 5-alpha reductase family enzyme